MSSQNEEGSFSKGVKITFGVVFALFFLGVAIPCATCGGCAMLGGVSSEMQDQADREAKKAKGLNPDAPDVEVASVNYKITKKNDVYWKYAYQFELTNNTDRVQNESVDVVFKDADGFEIDTDSKYGLSVPAGQTKEFSGSIMITNPEAQNVSSIEVK